MREGLAERITHRLSALLDRRDALIDLSSCEIARPIDEDRQLVGISRAGAWRRSAAPIEKLVQRADRFGVGAFAAQHLVEERLIEREKRGPLLGARRIIAVHPIHHEPEL